MQNILPTLLILTTAAAVTVAALKYHASRARDANRNRRLIGTARRHRETVHRYQKEHASLTH